jgi:hypothetical protein
MEAYRPSIRHRRRDDAHRGQDFSTAGAGRTAMEPPAKASPCSTINEPSARAPSAEAAGTDQVASSRATVPPWRQAAAEQDRRHRTRSSRRWRGRRGGRAVRADGTVPASRPDFTTPRRVITDNPVSWSVTDLGLTTAGESSRPDTPGWSWMVTARHPHVELKPDREMTAGEGPPESTRMADPRLRKPPVGPVSACAPPACPSALGPRSSW